MNKTTKSQSFKTAIHYSKLIPLGKKTPEKKAAVSRLMQQCKLFLKENS